MIIQTTSSLGRVNNFARAAQNTNDLSRVSTVNPLELKVSRFQMSLGYEILWGHGGAFAAVESSSTARRMQGTDSWFRFFKFSYGLTMPRGYVIEKRRKHTDWLAHERRKVAAVQISAVALLRACVRARARWAEPRGETTWVSSHAREKKAERL